ncbi:unnamed protein product [Schistosoma spindalis]|nr:unnamed protein product [Schistosoma spindale]
MVFDTVLLSGRPLRKSKSANMLNTTAISVERKAAGIWECKACKKVVAGGAYVCSTTAATTIRAAIRRLRDAHES